MAKSVAILGLGKYGKSLAENLYAAGADILVADKRADLVREFSDRATVAITADLRNEEEIRELGIGNMDVVVVCIGSGLEPSIMCVNVAKEEGVPLVIAKVSNERMASILLKVGADRVINPEEETGLRTARKITSPSFLEYFDLDDELCMIEVRAKEKWAGKNLRELDLRKKYRINVISVKEQERRWNFVDPEKPLAEECTLLIMTEKKNIKNLNL